MQVTSGNQSQPRRRRGVIQARSCAQHHRLNCEAEGSNDRSDIKTILLLPMQAQTPCPIQGSQAPVVLRRPPCPPPRQLWEQTGALRSSSRRLAGQLRRRWKDDAASIKVGDDWRTPARRPKYFQGQLRADRERLVQTHLTRQLRAHAILSSSRTGGH